MEPLQIIGTFNDDDRRTVRRAYWAMHFGRAWGWHVESEADGALVRYPWARVAGHRVTRGVALVRIDTGAMIPLIERGADAAQWKRAREVLRERCRPI